PLLPQHSHTSSTTCTIPSSSTLALFFFNVPATTEIYTLSLHDALPISTRRGRDSGPISLSRGGGPASSSTPTPSVRGSGASLGRSEEHTSELQSLTNLVCRLLLEKKKVQ